MKHLKKVTLGFLAITVLSTVSSSFTPVLANEINNTDQVISNSESTFQGLTDDELKDLGFSSNEIRNYHNNLENEIYLKNGKIVKSNSEVTLDGKFTAAVKIIRKGYNKLPKKVKQYIAAHTGLETFLGFIENATGTIQDAVYKACIKVGMNKTVANIVTAAIMTLVF